MSGPATRKTIKLRLLRVLPWLALAALLIAAAGFGWMLHKDSDYFVSAPYVRSSVAPATARSAVT